MTGLRVTGCVLRVAGYGYADAQFFLYFFNS